MTLMSRKADYALVILSHLHRHAGGRSAREIAEAYDLSRTFIANILKELCQKGFVNSQRGVNGGYSLARPPETVALGELLEALDEGIDLTECSHDRPADPGRGDQPCSLSEVCPVKTPVREIHRRIREVLFGVTLAELFGAAAPGFEMLPPPALRGRPAALTNT